MRKVFARFLSWLLDHVVQPDPWEPPMPLEPGQMLLRTNDGPIGSFQPGRCLAVIDDAEQAPAVAARYGVERYIVTFSDDVSVSEGDLFRAADLANHSSNRWATVRTVQVSALAATEEAA